MPGFRKDRVADLIREVISDIIRLKIKDPRVLGVTITEVKMAGDLKSAMVFFGALADGKNDVHKEGLEAAQGFIRRELRRQLDLRYIPSLSFAYDTSFDNFARIDRILKEIDIPNDDNDSADSSNSSD